MVFSGANLSGAIATAGGHATNAAPQFMASASGHMNRLIRSNPNSIADGSIGRFSIPRAELAAMAQAQAADPIGTLIANSSRAWTGIGATHAA